MIEKPKRPKKPDIQERQPPRTLQELINRYDLDNTKIYDFLDELVELLNTERKSIDTSINDLNNNKVNKSGDTMTGALLMQGNPIGFGTTGNIFWKEDGYGDKFRVIPDFGNAGENNKLIIQSTTGGAGEDPQNWIDLVTIHADTGEIDLKVPSTWINANLSQNVGGLIRYFKVGKMVVVQFQDLNFSVNVDQGFIFATGLPSATTYIMSVLIGFDRPDKPLRVAVNEQGQIVDHWANVPTGTGNYYGYLIYIAQD